jgi:hypothetical protein
MKHSFFTFQEPSKNLPRHTEENHERLLSEDTVSGPHSNQRPPEYEAKLTTTE